MYRTWLLLAFAALVQADVFLHSPRGSNGRVKETNARRNNKRLFDSENNANGGYNVGETTIDQFTSEDDHYRMKFFQSGSSEEDTSFLHVEWTNQHGCTGQEQSSNHKSNCNLVIQYMCQPDCDTATGTKNEDCFRNGVTTDEQGYTRVPRKNMPANRGDRETQEEYADRREADIELESGQHESHDWYDKCYLRQQNEDLFTADQNVRKSWATRQNNNGARHGYECPTERDYYPFWHPNPWTDLAVLAGDEEYCGEYEANSYNSRPYHECLQFWENDDGTRTRKPYSQYVDADSCTGAGGVWAELHSFLEKAPELSTEDECVSSSHGRVEYIWAVPDDSADGVTEECLVAPPAVDCQPAGYARVNHLGNDLDGEPMHYTWELPHFPSGEQQRCVLRIRYNISTNDAQDQIVTNPEINVLGVNLQLAINTAQFGRTFQDRTHVFLLAPRTEDMDGQLYNLNVRGRRGNLQQTSPVVEYDFVPNKLEVTSADMVHIQWTGSNTYNERDAGQGTAGTDRHNFVQMADLGLNYPMTSPTMFEGVEIVWTYHGHEKDLTSQDVIVSLASSGYYMCAASDVDTCPHVDEVVGVKEDMQSQLNDAPPSYAGLVLRFRSGEFHYMSTRNNAFSNRSQKGTLIVHPSEMERFMNLIKRLGK